MPPRKDSSVFSLNELPNIDYDINSKQALELAQFNDEDIKNSQSLCAICGDNVEDQEEKDENNKVLGFCTFLEKMNANFERNKFLSDPKKIQFSAAISVYRSLIVKISINDVDSIEIREGLEKIGGLLLKCMKVLYDSAYFNLIDHCEKNMNKRFKKVNRFIEDQELADEDLNNFLSDYEKNKKKFFAVLDLMKTELSLTQCNSALSALRLCEKSLDNVIALLLEKYNYEVDKRLSSWMTQEILSTLDFKAMMIGKQIVGLVSDILFEAEEEEETKKEETSKTETSSDKNDKEDNETVSTDAENDNEYEEHEEEYGEPTKENFEEEEEDSEAQNDSSSKGEEEEYTKEEDETLEVDSEDESSKETQETTDDKEISDEMSTKQTARQKKIEKLQKLINPILQLDCNSESPILAAFWISKLCEMKHISHDVLLQSFVSIFTEMRHFLEGLDISYHISLFFRHIEELYTLNAYLQTYLRLGKMQEYELLINELDTFYMSCKMITTSIRTLPKMFYTLECSRRIMKIIQTTEIKDEKLLKACDVFKEIRAIFIPIVQIAHAIEGLNDYAFEMNLPIERLELNFPNNISLDVLPYTTFSPQRTVVNKFYEDYVYQLSKEIEDSGIQIINTKAKNKKFSIEHLVVPSIHEILRQAAEAIKDSVPEESHLQDFANNMQTCMVDGRNLIDVIKEFCEFSAMAVVNEEPNEKFERVITLLKKIFNVHTLFITLEIGGLASYSNALHYTYLRVYSQIISVNTMFDNQSLLAPVSCRLLVDIQRIMQNKLQSDILEQRVALLNRMKMVLGDLVSVAFEKQDCAEFDNISQWVDIVMQLCQMNDVDGVQQIKPLCINLPKLKEFPQLAEDLLHLVESPPLTDRERKAIDHIQAIYSAEFNGEDVTTTYSDIGKLAIVAMTRDYTELLRRAKDYGFASIDDDYELGQYGDSYTNRFIEHHWRINLCQIDDFIDKIVDTLPERSPETEELYDMFSVVKFGGLTLVNVIKFGKAALKARKLFSNSTEFTCLYRMLHILVSYLEHHDALAELIGQIANSSLIAFSFLRTFNYLRFVKYLTELALKLNTTSIFTTEDSALIFSQCMSLRTYATTIKPTMKLTDEACKKLKKVVDCIDQIFQKKSINFDILFAKAKLCLKTYSLENGNAVLIEKLINFLQQYQKASADYNSYEMYIAFNEIKKAIYETESKNNNSIDQIMKSCITIFSAIQLRACVEPANIFMDNGGFNHLRFANPYELAEITTFSHSGTPRFQAFTIPRPRITIPSTMLEKTKQEQMLTYFEKLQEERKETSAKMEAYNKTLKEKEDQAAEFKEIYDNRYQLFRNIYSMKDRMAEEAEEEDEHIIAHESRPVNRAELDLRRKLTQEYEKRSVVANVLESQITETTEELRKQGATLAGMSDESALIFKRITQNSLRESQKNEKESTEKKVSNHKVDIEGVDKQLMPILKLCGYISEEKKDN